MSSEKARMLQGERFNSKDPQLCEERLIASKLISAYNSSTDEDTEQRLKILTDLLGSAGDGMYSEPPLFVEYGRNISVGQKTFLNYYTVILDVCPVTIGEYVLFGPAVQVYAAAHPLSPAERKSERRSYGKPIEIGADVWVGGRAIICPGVKIGEGSVIGAGSVVTEDVPPYSLAVGNPSRVIRNIADENCPKMVTTNSGSDKEKMLRGELYYALGKELTDERIESRKLQIAFNNSTEDEQEKRKDLIKKLFAKVGEDTVVETPFYCDYGSNTTLGKNVHIHSRCSILDVCTVTIGDNVILGHSVQVYGAGHPLSAKVRRAELEFGKPMTIGSDVWVGNGSILCPGINVGNGSVIGAGSVVTKDIPPNVFAAGNPCRVLEEINNEVK